MKLMHATLRPGTIIEVLDNGNIKASAPGLFSKKDIEKLPPIMPFFNITGMHANAFSKPILYDDVWILNLTDNPRLLYWFRRDKSTEANKNIINDNDINVEVICNKEVGADWASIYFSDGTGWVISKGESKILIESNGNIFLSTGDNHGSIKISGDTTLLGDSGDKHVAYGETIVDICLKISKCLDMVKLAANTNPYTKGIATAIGNTPSEIENKIPDINSKYVTIDF